MKQIILTIIGILLVSGVIAVTMEQVVTVTVIDVNLIDIISPLENDEFGDDKVLINVKLNQEFEKLYYSDNGGRYRRLCKNCDEYEDEKRFKDGFHDLSIRTTDENDLERFESVNFFVDETEPDIDGVEPRRYCNGSFIVEYEEEYLEDVTFYWKEVSDIEYNEVNLEGCESGEEVFCSVDVNLPEEEIEYFFIVSDKFSEDVSRNRECLVDTIAPAILNVSYEIDGRYVYFEIELDSEARYLKYMEDGREKRLCSTCDSYGIEREKRKRFSRGVHEIVIFTEDRTGNKDFWEVEFEI
ncbi:hypothetical protein CL618_03760 [archaeon]|nr:hypothetical protein [archaeon]|tara:strand:+ start:3455 stop:4348 length:894 start_codon:yes stop_codon:yes gene_type:complete